MTEYATLFAWSFLAATILPLGSEVPVAAVVRHRDAVLIPVLVATAGNSLGGFTTYWLGRKAADIAGESNVVAPRARRAAELLRRYGQPAVFFSWVPLIGDALVAAAGASAMPVGPFASWMIAGKAVRYVVLALTVRGFD